jgi:superfamily II DNA or RNA helicase
MQLREYQKDIVEQSVKSQVSTLIQIPTGGGKTVIAKEIIIDLINNYNQKILFVAPKIILMEQTAKVFKGLKPQIVHGTKTYDKNHNILISTIQTASKREDLSPDVIIIDEIHYGFDGKMIENLKKNKPNARIIGLSATPYDKNGRLLSGFELILNKYDMQYMIENNFLVPIKSYVLAKLNLSKVKVIAGDYDLKQLGSIVCNSNTILEIVRTTKEYIEKSKKTIVFAVSIDHAELLTKSYLNEGFNVKVLHSKMSKEEISKQIKLFEMGHTKILVSVLMLTTGFDVPDTDMAVIARPTKSQNLYKQMVGRIARLTNDETYPKPYATLLDCGNVIENLGDPIDDIKLVDGILKKIKLKCDHCKSEGLKLVSHDDNKFWKCKDCKYIKKIQRESFICVACNTLFNKNSSFIFENNRLFLKCVCGEDTLISEYTGKEVLIEYNGKHNIRQLETEQYYDEEINLAYEKALIKHYGEFCLSNIIVKKTIENLKKLSVLKKDELMCQIIDDNFGSVVKEDINILFKHVSLEYYLHNTSKSIFQKYTDSDFIVNNIDNKYLMNPLSVNYAKTTLLTDEIIKNKFNNYQDFFVFSVKLLVSVCKLNNLTDDLNAFNKFFQKQLSSCQSQIIIQVDSEEFLKNIQFTTSYFERAPEFQKYKYQINDTSIIVFLEQKSKTIPKCISTFLSNLNYIDNDSALIIKVLNKININTKRQNPYSNPSIPIEKKIEHILSSNKYTSQDMKKYLFSVKTTKNDVEMMGKIIVKIKNVKNTLPLTPNLSDIEESREVILKLYEKLQSLSTVPL